MKNRLSLVFAILLVFALFAGCAGNNEGKANTSKDTDIGKNTSTPAPTVTDAQPEVTEASSPYNFAVGKYKLNDAGFPAEKYEYELPLSSTDEVFTQWTVCYTPQYLPEDGYDGLSMYDGMQKSTGVDIEYVLISAAARAENFAVLVNSDSLCDIMVQGSAYWTSGPLVQSVEDGYFANFYEYKDYLPNYLYEVYIRGVTDKNVMSSAFYSDDIWISMVGFSENPLINTGYFLRQDFMDELNLGSAHDVKTFDQLYEILKAFKAAKGPDFVPMMVFSTFEYVMEPVNWCGYNTTPCSLGLSFNRVVNGEVQFCGTTTDDRDLLMMLNKWWSEGLIDPNWSSTVGGPNDAVVALRANDLLGCTISIPSGINEEERACINPDCQWEPIRRLRKTEDQIIHWGFSRGKINSGSATFSAKCKNLPLLMTFMDWQYSDSGSDWTNWGPEGELWEYDASGKRMLTEFTLTHPAGTSWLQNCYCYNELAEPGIQHWSRNFAYPGGDRFLAMYDVWDTSSFYDGAYTWPTGVHFTSEQQAIINSNKDDASTYFSENCTQFFTGDKPFSEWDNYIKAMMDMGLSTVLEVYQEAYDDYIKGK